MAKKLKVGIIGAGNMGAAIIGGIYKKHSVCICEMDVKRRQSIKRKYKVQNKSYEDLFKSSTFIILAVKPQSFDGVLTEIKPFIENHHVLISIAAGITQKYIVKRLYAGVKVIRTMPNLPAQIQRGVTGMCSSKSVTQAELKSATEIFQSVGIVVKVGENQLDAITAVSGSGPAYVFQFIECFMNASKSLGLDEKMSAEIVLETIKGSVELLESQKDDASVLRKRVTSKGGTTQAALESFQSNKIEQVYKHAIKAAQKRAKELSR